MSNGKKRKVPLGQSLNWGDDDIEQLADVTPEEIERAAAFWRNYAPRAFRNLLDAQPVEDELAQAGE